VNKALLLAVALALFAGAEAQRAGITTRARAQHSIYAVTVVLFSYVVMTFIVAVLQGITRLMAGGKVPGKLTAHEDEYFGCCFGNNMMDPQIRENRQKLANRMQNIAQNSYETPAICLIVFVCSLYTVLASGAYNRRDEYAEKISQLAVSFIVFRVLYVIAYLAGINFTFLPVRSFFWYASLATAVAAGCLGLAGAIEGLAGGVDAVDATTCVDGVGCVCKTVGCLVGVLVGTTVAFTLILAAMSYAWLSARPFAPYQFPPGPVVMATPPPMMAAPKPFY
jgi:uncharacterized MAPEG superfamily protein